jgi:hypothetical protein
VPEIPAPQVAVTCYEVSCVPEGHPDRSLWSLTVEVRSPGRWAVLSRGFCYDADGEREYESIPSERADEFRARFRHSLDDALALAKRIAPTMRVNRFTVADALAMAERGR